MESKSVSEVSEVEVDIAALKAELQHHHQSLGWSAAQKWFQAHFGDDVTMRMKLLNTVMYADDSAIIYDEELAQLGVEKFHLLQGDVIRSTVASVPSPVNPFSEGDPYLYIVIPTTCSVQKFKFVSLARLIEVKGTNKSGRGLLKKVLENLNSAKYFYLPPLPGQDDDCIGNLAHFEEIAFIPGELVPISDRVVSLSDIGWHLYNSFLTYHYTRVSPEEISIRGKVPAINTVTIQGAQA